MKKAIIVVSFGTTYELTRKLCIESIENRIKEKYEDFLVVRAFTSQMVINKLKKRDNYFVDNPMEALYRIKEEKIYNIFIQPLHIIPGYEYEKLLKQVEKFNSENSDFNIKIGRPLLYADSDYIKVVEALDLDGNNKDKAIVFMGHGTEHSADNAYIKLEETFNERWYKNIYIGTVEGNKTIDDIVPHLKENNIKKVDLMPFMLVAGDHAINDMASEEEDSWRSRLVSEGIETNVVLKGLGEVEGIQNIYMEHLEDILTK
ncbi:sirohydrochlorin cobaltochelatase [Alkaliphilus sp. B6464]|uniref:sirohydrochlorin cobaltochelatase n=1 Tax=Alkaliphilus sp. B6464 TaxID=2731219 RepID=UPI001BAA1FF4|nr:sirohydrochlorin cobaltochelatase [Alkaliphilus sp. B6464]QUH19133.1 sirohydrochlorin cobaltochelatase [Alkaliphilus sp. B6464]